MQPAALLSADALSSKEWAPLEHGAAALLWRVLHPLGNSGTRCYSLESVPSVPV